jgi:phosphoadenosine phosphosulfate reductase
MTKHAAFQVFFMLDRPSIPFPQATPLRQDTAPAVVAAPIAAAFAGADLATRLSRLRDIVTGRIVFTTSFGIEDQAVSHAILDRHLPIDIVTLDTGRLFPETYDVWARTEERYGARIAAVYPQREPLEALVSRQGIDGFRQSVDARRACCDVRKVEPLRRALAGGRAWVTGLRAGQSADRSYTPAAAHDANFGLLKINPLFDWSRDDVVAFVEKNGVPFNVLHDRGFPSIGCAPCTRAIAPGEPERAGRWWWEQDEKKECGLHRHPAAAHAVSPLSSLASHDDARTDPRTRASS